MTSNGSGQLGHDGVQVRGFEVGHPVASGATVCDDTLERVRRDAARRAKHGPLIIARWITLKKCPVVLDKLFRHKHGALLLFKLAHLASEIGILFFQFRHLIFQSFRLFPRKGDPVPKYLTGEAGEAGERAQQPSDQSHANASCAVELLRMFDGRTDPLAKAVQNIAVNMLDQAAFDPGYLPCAVISKSEEASA